jgi:hypothetical protein
MARPRRFVENIMARFPKGTLAKIDDVLETNEDRPGFVRKAVEYETELRQRKFYQHLPANLLHGETEITFCLKAIAVALERRRTLLAEAEDMNYRAQDQSTGEAAEPSETKK